MPRLQEGEVFRRIKPVDLAPVLEVLDSVSYFRSGQSGKYAADVALGKGLPGAFHRLVAALELGGTTARAVLRKLAPRQDIPAHVDNWMPEEVDWRRFQVPIVSDPRVVMRWPNDGVEVHLEPGWLYEVCFGRVHEVAHGADVERIHLQVDQVNATI
jgi:hypothetical protein